jgi:RNA 2',3'-cyclic 3'-phosphodiesterase
VIRAFIAVEIDRGVIQRITDVTHGLGAKIPDIRWTHRSNWHLTLKFLGAIDEHQVESLGDALAQALSLFPHCIINAKGLGVFPDVKRPRVLWVGIEGKRLAALVERVEVALGPLGFAKEQRAFKPHLTIGRWREGKRSSPELGQALETWRASDFGNSRVAEVKLFQSILKPGGVEYRPLKSVRLRTSHDCVNAMSKEDND